jgi:hypothetical protein
MLGMQNGTDWKRSGWRAGLGMAVCCLLAFSSAAQEGAERWEAPALAPVGEPTILVTKSLVSFVDRRRGAPIKVTKLALAEAIRRARPGDVIGVDGQLGRERPIQVGGGTKGQKSNRADWKGRAISDLTIIGLGKKRSSVIAGLELWQTYGDGSPSGGVHSLRLQNLTLRASEHTRQPIIIPKGHTIGRLTIVDCTFRGAAGDSFGGFGQKWGIRSAGRGSFDIRNSHCAKVQEHFLYLDSPQGDNYFIGLSMEKSWRTMIQLVNRERNNPGPAGAGRVLIEDCHAKGIRGEGGGAFTIAGHLGQVLIRDCSVRDSDHAAVVAWTDPSQKHGAFLERAKTGAYHSIHSLEIDGLQVDMPHADRPHLQISGCQSFVLRNFTIKGNQTALALDSPHGVGPVNGKFKLAGKQVFLKDELIQNGSVLIDVQGPVADYAGFQSARKVWRGDVKLNAKQMNALGAKPKTAPAAQAGD